MDDKWKGRHQFFIRPTSEEARKEVLDYLEQKGYIYNDFPDREKTFPRSFRY